MTQQSFSGAHAAQIAGITYRQLDYWARTNLIRPSLVDAKGSGSRRSHVDTDIAAAHIVISGKAVVLCQGDQLVDVLRNGQGVLNVLPLAAVKSDVDAMIVNIATQKVAIRSTIESSINVVATESVAQAIAL